MDEPARIRIPNWIEVLLRVLVVLVSVIVMLYAVLLLMDAFSILFGHSKVPANPAPTLTFHITSHFVAGLALFISGGTAISGSKKGKLKIVLIGAAVATLIWVGILVLDGQSLWTLHSV
jgi:hypothetical protein